LGEWTNVFGEKSNLSEQKKILLAITKMVLRKQKPIGRNIAIEMRVTMLNLRINGQSMARRRSMTGIAIG